MRLRYRAKISLVALAASLILAASSLLSPGVGKARVEARAHPLGHRHVRGSMIICSNSDVQSCHREFAHKHRGQPAHHE